MDPNSTTINKSPLNVKWHLFINGLTLIGIKEAISLNPFTPVANAFTKCTKLNAHCLFVILLHTSSKTINKG